MRGKKLIDVPLIGVLVGAIVTAFFLGGVGLVDRYFPSVKSASAQSGPISSFVKLQTAATATGNGTVMDTSQLAVAVIQTSGTFVGTVTYEASADGSVWSTLTCYTISGSSGATTATAAAIVRCNVAGYQAIRGRVSAFTSGTITSVASGTSIPMPFLATSN